MAHMTTLLFLVQLWSTLNAQLLAGPHPSQYIYVPGDIMIGSVLPLTGYEAGFRNCKDIDPMYVLNAETILWAVDRSNERLARLGYNMTIGTVIRNSCSNGVISVQESMYFFETQSANGGMCRSMENRLEEEPEGSPLVHIYTTVSSEATKRVAPIAEKYCMPVIGTLTTSPEFSNRKNYPNFLRVVPDDTHQSQGIIALLAELELSFVTIVFEHTAYGDHFAETLMNDLKKNRPDICVEQQIGVLPSRQNWKSVLDNLWNGKSRVVIALLDISLLRNFFEQTYKRISEEDPSSRDFNKFLWIGVDAWCRRPTESGVQPPNYRKMINNAICLQPMLLHEKNLQAHLNNLHTNVIRASPNPWLKKLFEEKHNCSLEVEDSFEDRHCHKDWKIDVPSSLYGVGHYAVEAVFVVEHAIDNLIQETCTDTPCTTLDLSKVWGQKLLEAMENVTFTIASHKFKFYKGQGLPRYSISQYQYQADTWLLVGTYDEYKELIFDPNEAFVKPIPFNLNWTSSIQECTPKCKSNEKKDHKADTCCYRCKKCKPWEKIDRDNDGTEECIACPLYQMPDENNKCSKNASKPSVVYGISRSAWPLFISYDIVGLIVILVTFCCLIWHHGTPLTEFQHLRPSSLLLPFFIHILLLLLPNAIMHKPSSGSCAMFWIATSTLYTAEMGIIMACCLRLSYLRRSKNARKKSSAIRLNSTVDCYLNCRFFIWLLRLKRFATEQAPPWVTQVCCIIILEFLNGVFLLITFLTAPTPAELVSGRESRTGKTYEMCWQLSNKPPLGLSMFIISAVFLSIAIWYLEVKQFKESMGTCKRSRRHILCAAAVLIFSLCFMIAAIMIDNDQFCFKSFLLFCSIFLFNSSLPCFFYMPACFLLTFKPHKNTWSYLLTRRMGYIDVCKDDISVIELLGSGNYGEVCMATLHIRAGRLSNKTDVEETVVVKKLYGGGSRDSDAGTLLKMTEAFQYESEIMRMINHENIIPLVGICHEEKLLVLRYMNEGSLEKFLRKPEVRECKNFGTKVLFDILMDVVSAVKYLHKQGDGIIHRDIAARNVFVEKTGKKPHKIRVLLGDFGLAKNLNSRSKGMKNKQALPLIWSASESFQDVFVKHSDIWALGVLMYEIFSWGADPLQKCHCGSLVCQYPVMNHSQIMHEIYREKRCLTDFQPFPCRASFSPSLETIMRRCWLHKFKQRPCASSLSAMLKKAKKDIIGAPKFEDIQGYSSHPGSMLQLHPVQSPGPSSYHMSQPDIVIANAPSNGVLHRGHSTHSNSQAAAQGPSFLSHHYENCPSNLDSPRPSTSSDCPGNDLSPDYAHRINPAMGFYNHGFSDEDNVSVIHI